MAYLFAISVVLGVAFIAWTLRKKKVDEANSPSVSVSNVGTPLPNPGMGAQVPPAPDAKPSTGADNPGLRAYLNGGTGGNDQGVVVQADTDDRNRDFKEVPNNGGDFVWVTGTKTLTIKNLEAGRQLMLEVGDSSQHIEVSAYGPSGNLACSFDAPAGQNSRTFILPESGDYKVMVTNPGPARTSCRYTRY